MEPEPHIAFGPFRLGLETPQARLWRGEQALTLRARSLAVLRYLVEHPGRLVTKAELRQHVWAGMHVTDTVLRVCIRDIRRALDDAAAAPQYLETVGGEGYRWLVRGERSVPPRVQRDPLWGASAKSTPWKGGSSAPPPATASSSSSVGKWGLARRRCWTCGWRVVRRNARCGWRGASASSTQGRASRTSPC